MLVRGQKKIEFEIWRDPLHCEEEEEDCYLYKAKVSQAWIPLWGLKGKDKCQKCTWNTSSSNGGVPLKKRCQWRC